MRSDLFHRLKIFAAEYSTFGALVLLVLFFSLLNPRFATLSNLEVVTLNAVELGVIAIPAALLVMSGSVDLSVGSVASVSAVLGASVMVRSDSVLLGLAVGLLFGLLAGALNGALIALLELNPIVVTLGFLGAWGGLALFLTGGTTVAGLPAGFRDLARVMVGPVPLQIIILILVIGAGWWALNRRPFGRELLAVGGSRRAAHLMGVRVKTVQFVLFVATGLASSLAGLMLAGKLVAAPPTVGLGLELQVLLVILIGGVAFEGGVGKISGVVAGLMFIGALNNGLIIVGVSQFLQAMITGLALVAAVVVDSSIRRNVRSAWARIGKRELRRASDDEERADVGHTWKPTRVRPE